MIYFDKIEVVNKLSSEHAHLTIKEYGINYDKLWIFDKVHHEINQFCSSHTLEQVYIEQFSTLDEALRTRLQDDCDLWKTGINIVAIRVTKPRIPDGVRKNYEEVEQQKTQFLITSERQGVVIKEEETQKFKAKMSAEKDADVAIISAQKEANVASINAKKEASVSAIRVETMIAEKIGEQTRSNIENEMVVEKQKALADAASAFILAEAEANSEKLTPTYLRSVLYESLARPEKVFFGDSMSEMFLDWMPHGEEYLFGDIAAIAASKEGAAKAQPTTEQTKRS